MSLSFEINQLKGNKLNKPIYAKEILVILHVFQKWHPYLIGRYFKVKTDRDSLNYLLEKQLSSEYKQKWVTKILCYYIEIIYKKGKHNVVEDVISRKEEKIEGSLCSIFISQFEWVEEERIEWKKDQRYVRSFNNYKRNQIH
jgi:hypothetical protein